jgi:hypothetical protein
MRPKQQTPRPVGPPNGKAVQPSAAFQVRHEWGDARAVQSRFGICKSTLYRLSEDGKIRSSSLRERGKLRGKRLFSMDSIAAYIESMTIGGEETKS